MSGNGISVNLGRFTGIFGLYGMFGLTILTVLPILTVFVLTILTGIRWNEERITPCVPFFAYEMIRSFSFASLR